ncbi:hypothetical protein J2W30_005411 [Variovorax boronicumulans]|nr:hypothetical protein [Variovorax boronicumulans]
MAVVLPKPAGARTSTSFAPAAAIASPMVVRGTCVATKAGGLSLVSRILGEDGGGREEAGEGIANGE